ncbi:hypothetical protein Ple7327_2393 [Pleurocapsa sp. PCC 7327]|nr:hypothetical protein Ple7327_2393 [Pleurocapsa sp. PCC 7327]
MLKGNNANIIGVFEHELCILYHKLIAEAAEPSYA